MNKVRNLLFTSFAGILVYFVQCSCNISTANKSAQTAVDSNSVLLVSTGFANCENDILLDSINEPNFGSNMVYLESDKELVKHFFEKSFDKFKAIKSIHEFQKIAKEKYLLSSLENADPRFRNLSVNGISYFKNPGKYALAIKGKRNQFTRFMLTGVTAITRAAGTAADANGYGFLIEKVKPYFEDAELVHISNEVSFLENCAFVKGTKFCSKEEHFKALTDLHCNIVELTGNHNKDYGSTAFLKTLEWYKNHGIKYFGGGSDQQDANKPLVLDLPGGKKIGLIGFNEKCPLGECSDVATDCGANRYNREKAQKVIQEMRKNLHCDYIIASVQWSEWDEYKPHEQQKIIAKDLIDFGSDLVYGSQAHQIQQVEFYKNKPIFYGLGNFLFDQVHRVGVRQAFFLECIIVKGKIVSITPVFTFMREDRQNQIAGPEEELEMRKVVYLDELLYH